MKDQQNNDFPASHPTVRDCTLIHTVKAIHAHSASALLSQKKQIEKISVACLHSKAAVPASLTKTFSLPDKTVSFSVLAPCSFLHLFMFRPSNVFFAWRSNRMLPNKSIHATFIPLSFSRLMLCKLFVPQKLLVLLFADILNVLRDKTCQKIAHLGKQIYVLRRPPSICHHFRAATLIILCTR